MVDYENCGLQSLLHLAPDDQSCIYFRGTIIVCLKCLSDNVNYVMFNVEWL